MKNKPPCPGDCSCHKCLCEQIANLKQLIRAAVEVTEKPEWFDTPASRAVRQVLAQAKLEQQ